MASKEAIRVSNSSCNVDRISSLPDDILVHILFFLPTKYSVGTRILSTRWKYLFASVPILDFDYSLTTKPSVCTRDNFVNFVNWVVQTHNSLPIFKFRFNIYDNNIQETSLYSKIFYEAVGHSVRVIDINIKFSSWFVVPSFLFSCETLEILKLGGDLVLSIPDSVSLPCLKTLELRLAIFDSSTHKLFSSCHVLEDLVLSDCRGDLDMRHVKVIDFSNPTLKRLRIDSIRCHTLLLNVPILEQFDFVKSVIPQIYGESLKLLHRADISPYCFNDPNHPFLVDLLEKVCNARHLYLSFSVLWVFVHYALPFTTFHCLARLELGCVLGHVLKSLMKLFEKFANLQVLVFSDGFSNNKNASNSLVLPEVAPACVSLHLREIEFRKFSMLDIECRLVKYFLENAKLLDKMVIEPCLGMRHKMSKNLQSFSSYSTTCHIVNE